MGDLIVRHTVGTLVLEADDLVAAMAGTRGFFRKEAWSKTDRTPVASIRRLALREEPDQSMTLSIYTARSGDQPSVAYLRCGPDEAVEELVEEMMEINPSITVNNIDVGAQIRQLKAAKESADNEVVGITNRVTLTRVALGGPLLGLLFQKRQIVRRKDLR